MIHRLGIVAVLCIAGLAATAVAAPPKKPAAADSTAAARPAAKPKKPAAVRTIDAITIEGEIAVPQVLFITSRDNRRYRDGLGKQFRMSTTDVARALTAPRSLCVAGQSESHKEE
jgi:hypothetical protein